MTKGYSILVKRFFMVRSIKRLAFASSVGVFIGMLPLVGIRIPIMILVSFIFALNFVALLAGTLLTIIFPIVHMLTKFVYQKVGHFDIPFFTMRYLYAPLSVNQFLSQKLSFAATIISGIIISVLLYPLFLLIYNAYIKRYKNNGEKVKRFVFQDRSGKRSTVLRIFICVFVIACISVIAMFGISLSINPFLPDMGFKNLQSLSELDTRLQNTDVNIKQTIKSHKTLKNTNERRALSGVNKNKKVMAFYVSWDDDSFKSFKENYSDINIISPDWYSINDKLELASNIQSDVDELAKSHKIDEMPVVNNYINNNWDSSILHQILNVKNRSKLINNLVNELEIHKYSGLNLDFENINEADKKDYLSFVKQLYHEMNKNNLKLAVDLPASDETLDYKLLSQYCDYIVLMGYDEHYENSSPGSISSLKWYDDILNNSNIPSDKLICAIGDYGYDWIVGKNQPAQTVSFTDIMQIASAGNIQINWDSESSSPYLHYKKDGVEHAIWFLDGTTFYNQAKLTFDSGAAGVAVWRLGGEDPSIWNVLKNLQDIPKSLDNLSNIYCSADVRYSGTGEILYIQSAGKNGKRSITLNNDGVINNVKYISMPSLFQIKRFGNTPGKTIALTFDDGPDPYYTPRILDILKRYNVKASFFIVGENAADNPDILQRIYNEGHDIGNHTYTHPDISNVSVSRTKIELNSTQRLIEEITGHSTTLFRPPYVADAEPSKPNELIPVLRAQELGYVMVGELIDPLDWQSPKPDELYNRVITNINLGNIILLHDAGGNRDSTLEALPKLIEKLKKDGYKFVTVSDLMNKKRDDIMPSVKASESNYLFFDKELFRTVYNWHVIVNFIFYSAAILGFLRVLFLCYFSRKQKKMDTKKYKVNLEEGVTVVIAAYNEENVICKTIDSVLNSNYSKIQVIVIDDGSKDNTYAILKQNYDNSENVMIISKQNGGKTSALNLGFFHAKYNIVITIDADTVLNKDAIGLLASHFKNPKVAAVSGNVKVGNKNNLITLWQHIEYVTGFNLERRAYSMLNCITVVPGAIGAWRKNLIIKLGYFSDETLAEDADMTLALLKKGYKIKFEEKAIAYTEAPEDIKSLAKQRYRWSYGTLQCLWKHKNALFNSKYKGLGLVALPSMLIFQYLFLTVSPIADIYFIVGIFSKSFFKTLIFYLIFLIIDLIAAILSFDMEKESKWPLLLLIPQRIFYRIIMVYVVIKSIISAIAGSLVGWNKLKRRGTVLQEK